MVKTMNNVSIKFLEARMRVGFYFYIFYFLKLSTDSIKKLGVRAELVFLFFYFLNMSMDSIRKLEGRAGTFFYKKYHFTQFTYGGSIDHRNNLVSPNIDFSKKTNFYFIFLFFQKIFF